MVKEFLNREEQKMVKRKKAFVCAITLLFIMITTQSVFADKRAQYFEENYESGDLNYFDYINWEYKQEDNNGFISLPEGFTGIDKLELDYDYEDMDVMFDVRLDSINSTVDANFGVSFRRNDNGNDQYDVAYHTLVKQLKIRSYTKGSESLLASTAFEVKEGTWYKMGFRIKGKIIEWYIDGNLVLTAEDDVHKSGTFLIATYNNSISLDNVKIAKVNYLDMITGEFVTRDPETPTPEVTNTPLSTPSPTIKQTQKRTITTTDNTINPNDNTDRSNNTVMIIIISVSAVIILAALIVIIKRKGK
jgi:hypothetical protein